MTTLLRRARDDRGWSQGQLIHALQRRAATYGMTLPSADSMKSQVSRWENGRVVPDDTYRRLLREVYGLGDDDLGFQAPGLHPSATDPAGELTERLSTADRVDDHLVQLLQAQVDRVRLLDRRLGAPVLIDQTRAQVETLTSLLTHSVLPAQRSPLAKVLSDAATLGAWQALDVGSHREAWGLYETARLAAQEAQSPQLLAHAMGEQAYALIDLGFPDAACELLSAALGHRAVLPGLMRCWLTAALAEACAASGRADDCLRLLAEADHLLPADCDAPDLPYLALDATHLARWRGHCLARLGNVAAIQELQLAAQRMSPDFVRALSALRCDLARALLLAGEPDEARREAAQAMTLAVGTGSLRQRRRIQALSLAA